MFVSNSYLYSPGGLNLAIKTQKLKNKTRHSRHTGFELSQGPVGVNIQGGVCLLSPTFTPLSMERGDLFSRFLPFVLQVAVFSRKRGTKETNAQSNWKLNYSRRKGTVALRSPSACTLVTFVCGAHVLGTQQVNNST